MLTKQLEALTVLPYSIYYSKNIIECISVSPLRTAASRIHSFVLFSSEKNIQSIWYRVIALSSSVDETFNLKKKCLYANFCSSSNRILLIKHKLFFFRDSSSECVFSFLFSFLGVDFVV
jgi:hypothetical protein